MEGMELMASHLLNTDFWSEKKVLITGHTGFKGSWLTLWLNELNSKVTGISLEPDTKPNLFGQLHLQKSLHDHHIADIRDFGKISQIVKRCQPDVVFHLAAQPLVRRSYSDPLGTWSTNARNTKCIRSNKVSTKAMRSSDGDNRQGLRKQRMGVRLSRM